MPQSMSIWQNEAVAYLGIDLGTSGLRALLVGADGNPIGAAEQQYPTLNPHSGWSEQHPEDWIDAFETALSILARTYREFSSVKGIGVSGHMHGAVLLDGEGQVLRPCIMWNDTRSEVEARKLDETPGVRELSGNIVFPGFTAPKLEWVRQNEPEIFKNLSKVLLPAGYINRYLTGESVMDLSDASGTSWLDVGARRWSEDLLGAGHMRADQMPRLMEGSAPAGQLRAELAKSWGLSGPVVVAGGAADNAAAACGVGVMDEGQGFVSLGTSGVVLLARNKFASAPETAVHSFCHAVPDRWYQMGVMLSATNSLNWLASVSGQTPAELSGQLGDTLRSPGDVTCLPYFSGERTPHNDANVRASFSGISSTTSLRDLTQATMEGVAFGLRDSLEALRATGAKTGPLYLLGGGATSRYWGRLVASVLGIQLMLPRAGEFGAALGAARLAMVADSGKYASEVMHAPFDVEHVDPQEELLELFEKAYERFKSAYTGVSPVERTNDGRIE